MSNSFEKLREIARKHAVSVQNDKDFKPYLKVKAAKEAEYKEEAKRQRNTSSPEFLNRYYDI